MTDQPTPQPPGKTPDTNAEDTNADRSDLIPVIDPDILLGDSPVANYEPVALAGLLTPTSVELIIRSDPRGFLQLMREDRARQAELTKQRQQNQRDTAHDVQNTVRYAISGFIVLVAGILVYAWAAGDKQLPDRFITLTMGVLGGGGAGLTLVKASTKDKD